MHTFVSVASGTVWSEYNAVNVIHASVTKSRTIVCIKDYSLLKLSFPITLKFMCIFTMSKNKIIIICFILIFIWIFISLSICI